MPKLQGVVYKLAPPTTKDRQLVLFAYDRTYAKVAGLEDMPFQFEILDCDGKRVAVSGRLSIASLRLMRDRLDAAIQQESQ